MELISNKETLKYFLRVEKTLYLGNRKEQVINIIMKTENYYIWRFVYLMRKTEYHFNVNHQIRYHYYQRKKNILGTKIGVGIWKNNFDVGLRIWHPNIVVNGYAQIGKNCHLHGMNCIGNKGGNKLDAPVIGDNVDIGVGAKIIGNVYIADNVKIGANAVVTKSCYNEGAVLVGVPAEEK